MKDNLSRGSINEDEVGGCTPAIELPDETVEIRWIGDVLCFFFAVFCVAGNCIMQFVFALP